MTKDCPSAKHVFETPMTPHVLTIIRVIVFHHFSILIPSPRLLLRHLLSLISIGNHYNHLSGYLSIMGTHHPLLEIFKNLTIIQRIVLIIKCKSFSPLDIPKVYSYSQLQRGRHFIILTMNLWSIRCVFVYVSLYRGYIVHVQASIVTKLKRENI